MPHFDAMSIYLYYIVFFLYFVFLNLKMGFHFFINSFFRECRNF